MKRIGLTLALAAVIAVAPVAGSNPARADAFSSLAGIATDPLKLAHLSDRLLQALHEVLAEMQPLLDKGDAIAKARLAQVQEIVNAAIAGGQAVEAKAFADVLDLETKVMSDVNQVVFRAKCAANVVLNKTAQDAIVASLANIAGSQPTLTILGIPLIRLHAHQVHIAEPADAYRSAYAEVMRNLEQSVSDNTDPNVIFSALVHLESLAESTRCFYLDKPNEIIFVREQSSLQVEEQAWLRVAVIAAH